MADKASGGGADWSVRVPIIVAFFTLLGTGIGASITGFSNYRLEAFKFQAGMIHNALETDDQKEAARRLKFLVDAGLVDGLNTAAIAALAADPTDLPTYASAMPISEAKALLAAIGLYDGPIDDSQDAAFRRALQAFQQSVGLVPDGMLGPMTAQALRQAQVGAPGGR